MDNFIILDDNSNDYFSLRDTILGVEPKAHIQHVTDLPELYNNLNILKSPPYALVFVDVSLSGQQSPNKQGFEELAHLTLAYPLVPFVIVTGYFAENISAAMRDYFHHPQIIQILDKMTYGEDEIYESIIRAEDYRSSTLSIMERDSRSLTDYTDTLLVGEEHLSGRQHSKIVLEQVFQKIFTNLDFHDKSLIDLDTIAIKNAEWFLSAVNAIRLLNDSSGNAHPGSKHIEGCKDMWEIKGGRDLRIYYSTSEAKKQVCRVAPKPEQDRIIKWLRQV